MKLRTATLAAVLLTASIPNLPATAQARPFGFHGGFGVAGVTAVGVTAVGAGVVRESGLPRVPSSVPRSPHLTTVDMATPRFTAMITATPQVTATITATLQSTAMITATPRRATFTPQVTAMATRSHTRVTDATGMAVITARTELATARKGLGTVGTGPDTHERHMLDRCIEPTFATVSLSLRVRLLR